MSISAALCWGCCRYKERRSKLVRFIYVQHICALSIDAVYFPYDIYLVLPQSALDYLLPLISCVHDDTLGAVSSISPILSSAISLILEASSRTCINLLLWFLSFDDWQTILVCYGFLLSIAIVKVALSLWIVWEVEFRRSVFFPLMNS